MVEPTTTTVAMGFAVLGIFASMIWIALGWYGIRTLHGIRQELS